MQEFLQAWQGGLLSSKIILGMVGLLPFLLVTLGFILDKKEGKENKNELKRI